MITYIKKDVTTVEIGIVAHGCNSRGVQGSGVAAAIRKKWPQEFEPYRQLCEEFKSNPMNLLGYAQMVDVGKTEKTLFVANLITQLNYGRDGLVYADIDAIKAGISHVIKAAKDLKLPVYMPRIGCGLGGLSWEKQVGPILEQLDDENVEIYVCDL